MNEEYLLWDNEIHMKQIDLRQEDLQLIELPTRFADSPDRISDFLLRRR
jgi:hypothetical protein